MVFSLSWLAALESPHKKSKKPDIMCDPFDYPGCTLAVTNTTFLLVLVNRAFELASSSDTFSEIVKRGTFKPPSDRHSLPTDKISLSFYYNNYSYFVPREPKFFPAARNM